MVPWWYIFYFPVAIVQWVAGMIVLIFRGWGPENGLGGDRPNEPPRGTYGNSRTYPCSHQVTYGCPVCDRDALNENEARS